MKQRPVAIELIHPGKKHLTSGQRDLLTELGHKLALEHDFKLLGGDRYSDDRLTVVSLQRSIAPRKRRHKIVKSAPSNAIRVAVVCGMNPQVSARTSRQLIDERPVILALCPDASDQHFLNIGKRVEIASTADMVMTKLRIMQEERRPKQYKGRHRAS